ncbi:NGG1p interacting factor 3, NIF3, partial [gut metagenome]
WTCSAGVGRQSGSSEEIGWCTGAAQDDLLLAVDEGCELFFSGEISERTTYEAIENGVTYLAAGHHATERFGIQALGRHLQAVFPELQIEYFESNNIV